MITFCAALLSSLYWNAIEIQLEKDDFFFEFALSELSEPDDLRKAILRLPAFKVRLEKLLNSYRKKRARNLLEFTDEEIQTSWTPQLRFELGWLREEIVRRTH